MKSAKIMVPYKGKTYCVRVDEDKKKFLSKEIIYLDKDGHGNIYPRFKRCANKDRKLVSSFLFDKKGNNFYKDGNTLNLTSKNVY